MGNHIIILCSMIALFVSIIYTMWQKKKDKELDDFIDDSLKEIESVVTEIESKPQSNISPQIHIGMTNCPNCGAVITGDKCEYCGTVFNLNDEPYEEYIEYTDILGYRCRERVR